MARECVPVNDLLADSNKRQFPRVDARIEVQISTHKEFEVCYSQNISRGGIFLETHILPDPNASVELVLNLKSILPQEANPLIKLNARVVRLMTIVEEGKKLHKVGMQFVDLSPQTQIALDQLYEEITSRAK
jgi:hypothetical protein